ncbi:MAG: hypothetical protein OXF75_07180 [Acidimicrobiaceae bacterium]|nr:hypothetical protein [Acidimicrobiaceae bacterium]
MTDTLGVHISESHITAVRFDASSPDPPRVLVLGDSGVAAAAVVARGEDGSVLVGDEAASVTHGPRVTDPLQRALSGKTGALAAVLDFAIRGAVAVDAKTPLRLAVIVDDESQASARDRIVQAGVAAGMADTIVVPRSAAAAQPTPVAGVAALAAGAARAGSLSSARFVTREDLGQPITSRTPVVAVPEAPRSEPVSVFDDESPADPARPSLERLSSVDPREFTAAQAVGPVGPPAATAGSKTRPRSGASQAVITLALVVLVGVVGGLIIFLVGDDSADIATTESVVTEDTAVAEDTTPVDTEPPATDTSAAAASTTAVTSARPETEARDTASTASTASTTTSSNSTTSTTAITAPVGVGTPGPVTLVETGLQFDTGSVVLFDQPMAAVLAEVRSVLGAPDSATNFQTTDACTEAARSVRWGQLELVFLQDPPVAIPADSQDGSGAGRADGAELIPASTGTFGQWHATGHIDPTGLVTKDGLGVSATVGFMEAVYGASFEVVQPMEGEEIGLFSVANPASGGVINGTTSDVTPDGRVLNMWAGDACVRIFV